MAGHFLNKDISPSFCAQCSKEMNLETLGRKKMLRIKKQEQKKGKVFCSHSCVAFFNSAMHSERMTKNNPTLNPDTRKKISDSLKRIGHKPVIQGGNGKGLTKPQMMLLLQLGDGWFPELVVITGNGYLPYNYKIDIGNLEKKIAIEINGGSHNSLIARKRDLRKKNLLESKGYKVLSFTNTEILTDVTEVAQKILSTT
jgi:hypothetical protein